MSVFSYASNITTESNLRSFTNGSLIFGIDKNSQKLITSNETNLTISTADINISEGLYFIIYKKPRSKKILDLEMNVFKTYIPPNRNMTPK